MFYSEAQLNFDILDCTYVAKGKERVFSGLDYYIDIWDLPHQLVFPPSKIIFVRCTIIYVLLSRLY